MYRKDRKDAGGSTGPTGGKPFENSPSTGSGIPPKPSSPPPEGHEWQLQSTTGAGGQQKFFWAPVIIAAVSAIASYAQARQANKPRTGYTDQTTTQTPYMEGTIRPDIEAILNYQRQLINEGPHYVGDRRFWPTASSPQPGFAPPPTERSDQAQARFNAETAAWQAAGGGRDRPGQEVSREGAGARATDEPNGTLPNWAYDKAGAGAPGGGMAPHQERTFGGWTAAELEGDPSRVGELGDRGAAKYDRYRQRHPLEDMS